MNNYTNKKGFTPIKSGFSLVEMLVVISVFALIGILTTRAVSLTLRSSKKSDSLVRVRENVNYSLAVLERLVRNSQSVNCTTSTNLVLNYVTQEGLAKTFSCNNTDKYIASSGGRLTSSDILITSCAFTCTQANSNNPALVKLSISAEDANASAAEKGSISTELEIVTRNY